MCELFGASFNKQTGIQFAFTKFRKSGEFHRDGWGLAWYPDDNSSQIIDNISELEGLGVTHVLFYFPKIELTALHDVLDNFADGVLKQLP